MQATVAENTCILEGQYGFFLISRRAKMVFSR
jgi:hypothetical protein